MTESKYLLKLYILGKTMKTAGYIDELKTVLDRDYSAHYELEVVDLLEKPQIAEEEKIFATPTLVKRLPPPVRKVIGNLADIEKVLVGLELKSKT